MKCEHGNDITVYVEKQINYWEGGINLYDHNGNLLSDKRIIDYMLNSPSGDQHLLIDGCEFCRTIRVIID